MNLQSGDRVKHASGSGPEMVINNVMFYNPNQEDKNPLVNVVEKLFGPDEKGTYVEAEWMEDGQTKSDHFRADKLTKVN